MPSLVRMQNQFCIVRELHNRFLKHIRYHRQIGTVGYG